MYEITEKINITLTRHEWDMIAIVLERESFFKIHSYQWMGILGGCNYGILAEKIRDCLK